MVKEIKRGDIIMVDNSSYKEPHGSLIYGIHPAIVIQNDSGNKYSNNLIVVFASSKLKRLDLPTHVLLQWYEGLKKPTVVQAEQIATISKDDVMSIVDHLREEDMKRVEQAIITSLELKEVNKDAGVA